MQFKELNVGDSFDWIDDSGQLRLQHGFSLRCTKISDRKYRDETGVEHRVGTTRAAVFHHSPSIFLAILNGKI